MATGSRRGSRKRATLGVGSRGPGMSRMCSQVLAEVHRSILGLLRQITSSARVSTLLDVGCWDGGTTIEYSRAAGGTRILDGRDRKSTRLNSSHEWSSYAVFCLTKKITRRHAAA